VRFLNLDIQPQPDDTTCGPTCLHAVYRYYGEPLGLHDVIGTVQSLPHGGTLAVMLACHALRRGYQATIYTYNLHVFDPSWFTPHPQDVADKLRAQQAAKRDPRLDVATEGYLEFLRLGGHVDFRPLTQAFLRELLEHQQPILTGLSATYLYQEAREIPETSAPDDVRGFASGHFVLICGYDQEAEQVWVADPLHPNPLAPSHFYSVHVDLLMGAIMLGVMTYDANLLLIGPRRETPRDGAKGVPAWSA
jgi:hypothetical protein